VVAFPPKREKILSWNENRRVLSANAERIATYREGLEGASICFLEQRTTYRAERETKKGGKR